MGQLRLGARIFLLVVVAAGGALLVLQWWLGNWPAENSAFAILLVLGLTRVATDIWGVRLHFRGVHYTLTTAIDFVSLLLAGPAAASWAGCFASAAADVWARRAWYKTVFNSAAVVIAISAAGVVYGTLNDGSLVPLSSLRNTVAIVGGGLAYLAADVLIVCSIVALVEGHRLWDVWRASAKGFRFQMITLVPMATLIAVVYYQNPFALVLLLFPILLVHYSFQAYEQLREDAQRTMETLAQAVDRRDHYTYRHSERVADFSARIARQMGLDLTDTETLVAAARVHDLGKIGIDSAVLLKPGKLDPKEWAVMQEHPRIGADIIAKLPIYERVRDLVACHQERYDGKGYPHGYAGEQIPLGARIIAAADAYEAMTSDRPYRKALDKQVAMAELRKGRGTQFDPQVIDAFLAVLEAEEAPAGQPETPPLPVLGHTRRSQAAG